MVPFGPSKDRMAVLSAAVPIVTSSPVIRVALVDAAAS